MSDPANGEQFLASAIANPDPTIIEHRYERRVAVEVERNSKGYRWNISVAADDADLVRELVTEIDDYLQARFGE